MAHLAALTAAAVLVAAPAVAQAQARRVTVTGMPGSLNSEINRLLREEPAPASLFEAQRQADRAAEIVARLLESSGYYAAEVTPLAEGVDTFTREVKVSIGPLFTYDGRKIDYIGPAPDDTTKAELDSLLQPLATGVPAEAQPVIETGDALIKRLKEAGYPDATQEPVDVLADGKANTVELTFRVQPGLRYGFGSVKVSGLQRTKPQFIDNLRPWKPGERYSTDKMDAFRARLAETGLFDSATTSLAPPPDPPAQDLPGAAPAPLPVRDVIAEMKERKRNTIALGASASTSDGAGLDGQWETRNITGMGDSIDVNAQFATLQRRIQTTYTRPDIGHYGRNVRFGAKIEDFETDAFDQTGASVSASIDDRINNYIRGSLGVEAGYAAIADDRSRLAGTGRRKDWIVSGTATAEYIGVKDVLDPQQGIRARVAVQPGASFGDDNIGFAKLTGEASFYTPLLGHDAFVGALRGRVGTLIGPDGAPPDKLFYAGGGGSVRGYEYQSLSPRDANGVPIGGRSLVEMSAEVRWRQSPRLGYVGFIDAGAAGSNVEPPIDQMSVGAGFGVRYYPGFGPIRADIGFPLNKRKGDAGFQIYISIGQAF